MASITAQMVKALRDQTGAGMMDCKGALAETGGDMAAAVDWLRAKGLAKAAKKAGRVAAEGLIAVATDGPAGAVVEVNSETDFVARNQQFQAMVRTVAELALAEAGDVERIAAATFPGSDKTVRDYIAEMVGTIGENLALRRAARLEVGSGLVATYVHNAVADGLGRIGVIVAVESTADPAALATIGRQVAMHIAATNPLSVTVEDLDPAVIARERAVLAEQARETGKPDAIVEKMVEGRMRKFHEEVVLLAQTFVIDGERTVAKAIEDAAREAGAPIAVTGFVRIALGEGIERDDGDFAAEVAAAVSAN